MEIEETLMENLSAAWDAVESEEPEELELEPEVEKPVAEIEDPELEERPTLEKAGKEPPAKPKQASDLETPPAGLSPEAREVWKDVPAPVKAAIAKREEDYSRGIQMYASNAKRAEAMDRTLQPYSQLFAMNGGVQNTIPGLLQTASILQMGAPAQKADRVAQLIKQFGVDVRALDNALVGQKPPKEMQQQSEMDRMFNERLGPLQKQLETYQQREQREQQQQQQVIQTELQQFASSNEFYPDVRADMADLLDMAANRGRQMSLQEAYNTACQAHPQIAKIINGRTSAAQVGRKRTAASSIHGGPGGSMSADSTSLTAALHDAWDNAGRM
jgi:hypothetical protein